MYRVAIKIQSKSTANKSLLGNRAFVGAHTLKLALMLIIIIPQ